MASGIAISDKCTDAYAALSKRDHSAIILKINDEMTEVSVDKCLPATSGDQEGEWKALVAGLPENGCRFIITDFGWKETPTVTKSKIIMILWSAEAAPIRHKMIYATSMESVTSKMSVQKSIQATELDEITYDTIRGNLAK